MVAGPAEEQLTQDSTGKRDGVDVALGGRSFEVGLVEGLEYGVHLANDAVMYR